MQHNPKSQQGHFHFFHGLQLATVRQSQQAAEPLDSQRIHQIPSSTSSASLSPSPTGIVSQMNRCGPGTAPPPELLFIHLLAGRSLPLPLIPLPTASSQEGNVPAQLRKQVPPYCCGVIGLADTLPQTREESACVCVCV